MEKGLSEGSCRWVTYWPSADKLSQVARFASKMQRCQEAEAADRRQETRDTRQETRQGLAWPGSLQ